MTQEEITQEEITQSISAAYDSVNLINQLNALTPPLSDEDAATLSRNIEHLRVMMAKDWFYGGLTAEQTTEINAIIA